MAGALRYTTADGVVVDCAATQVGVPCFGSNGRDHRFEGMGAEFILVIEKDGTFQVEGEGGLQDMGHNLWCITVVVIIYCMMY